MNKLFPEYSNEYIEGVMSLRKPQARSLEILDRILKETGLSKEVDLEKAQQQISDLYPTFKGFDRGFMNLCFALATGVGKTRLMGVFIIYLYTHYNARNYFVVAPSLTIYEKLTHDFTDESSDKYVFKGVNCFSAGSVHVVKGEEIHDRKFQVDSFGDITVFIFNAQKFNSDKENRRVNKLDETIGDSFIGYLHNLKDLVVIMDEAHHYRNNSTAEALERIHPVLGLELTATPFVSSNISKKKQKANSTPFNNVVYEYSLAKSIRDGYTRTPLVLTRRDLDKTKWDDEALDKMMLDDGIVWHERMKTELKVYSENNDVKRIKPFMLVVCSNIEHAKWVLNYIKSLKFHNGFYANKVIEVDSSQKTGLEDDNNIKLLLDVERNDNPVEIVVHVNMLKEGWDVNNLYTIVPLRTANSRTLIEQTIGRGLRLPYGERTGNKDIDSVALTAHANFQMIVDDAQRDDSIFKKANIIDVIQLQPTIDIKAPINEKLFDDTPSREDFYKENPQFAQTTEREPRLEDIEKHVNAYVAYHGLNGTKEGVQQYIEEKDKDLAEIIKKEQEEDADPNADFYAKFLGYELDRKQKQVKESRLRIPLLVTEEDPNQEYFFEDFDLDTTNMAYVPVSQEIYAQNLLDPSQHESIKTSNVNFSQDSPAKLILSQLREEPNIDYSKCNKLLAKLIGQFLAFLKGKYDDKEISNIVFSNKKAIAKEIYSQMMNHFKAKSGNEIYTIDNVSDEIIQPHYNVNADHSNLIDLYSPLPEGKNIMSLVFEGGKKGRFNLNAFDSSSERDFAIACDNSSDVISWIRPDPRQFNIHYNHGKRYEPDFIVVTKDANYLVEVKAVKDLNDSDVIAKKDMGVLYCKKATDYCLAHGDRPWKYLLIPHDKISQTSTFSALAKACGKQ